jgi:hypothetical protein
METKRVKRVFINYTDKQESLTESERHRLIRKDLDRTVGLDYQGKRTPWALIPVAQSLEEIRNEIKAVTDTPLFSADAFKEPLAKLKEREFIEAHNTLYHQRFEAMDNLWKRFEEVPVGTLFDFAEWTDLFRICSRLNFTACGERLVQRHPLWKFVARVENETYVKKSKVLVVED